jgi:hypothetical protein
MPRLKVLIGIPASWDAVPVPFVKSLVELRKPPLTQVEFVRLATLDQMRNRLADMTLEGGFSHLFMLDADMVYPAEALTELLRSDVDIVCGLACRRTPPHVPVILQPTSQRFVFEVQMPEKRGLTKCGAVGGGGTLIKAEALRRVEPPRFSFCHQMPDGRFVGEDLYFCQKAADAGCEIYCRTDIVYAHLTTMAIVVDDAGSIGYRPLA